MLLCVGLCAAEQVIDYGTSNFCERGQHLHSKIGTARYVAPEVRRGGDPGAS